MRRRTPRRSSRSGRTSRRERGPGARRRERLLGLALALVLAPGLLALLPAPAAAQGRSDVLPRPLREQIESLRDAKRARTPAERKVSSRLLHAARMRRGFAVSERVSVLRTGVRVDRDGSVLVDVRARVSPSLLAHVETLGGRIVNQHPGREALRARVPLDACAALAAHADVRSVRPADRFTTRVVSEGDTAHRAAEVRALDGVNGSGIRVGVISDGVDALASVQGAGELPAVSVLAGQAGSGSEGVAMLEIVHDLAPGAQLLFATAIGGQAQFAANVEALRAAGADVIVDDIFYFAEPVFQDGPIAQAVDAVAAEGTLYFSSAGNSGNANDGTAGVWEGDFVWSGGTAGDFLLHDFGGTDLDVLTQDSPSVFTLHWADPLGASGNDYDLFLVDVATLEVLAASTDVQDGDDEPFELIDSTGFDDTGLALAVAAAPDAAPRFLHLNTNRGQLQVATDGQTAGHAAAEGALGVAAVDWLAAGGPGGVFDGSEPVEPFSSDGPRRVFYASDGTPITPGDLSSTGGALRAKPDLAAADCVTTTTPGFAIFCGTSAAAPHAAAVAALLLELSGGAGGAAPSLVRGALLATALDIEAPGPDRDSGRGLVDARAAADALLLPACANGLDDDGDGLVDFGEDPGCGFPEAPLEDPQCQDGVNNDPGQDAFVDFDGGASAGLPPAQQTAPDPQCGSFADDGEGAGRCGLGAELALLLGGAGVARVRRRRPR